MLYNHLFFHSYDHSIKKQRELSTQPFTHSLPGSCNPCPTITDSWVQNPASVTGFTCTRNRNSA
jgi:hypothetical protein